MAEEKENTEEKNTGKGKKQKNHFKKILGGSILTDERVTNQLPFVFFLVVLGLILITNRNLSEKTIRKIEVVQDTLKELKAESVIYETKLMSINRPSEVNKRVQERKLGLIEPKEPAMRIKIKKAGN